MVKSVRPETSEQRTKVQLINSWKCLKSLYYYVTAWSRIRLEKITGFAASQENPRILWNSNVYYRIHKLHATRPYTAEYRSNP